MANAPTIPVSSSVSAMAGRSGCPSASPLTAAKPDIDSAMEAKPGRCAYGPVCPNPLTRVKIKVGLMACRTSGPRPRRSSAPGRKFSTTTWASLTNSRKSSLSSRSLRSRVIVRLLRLASFHHKPTPSRGSFQAILRKLSPVSGRSTLMTSAP
ncbi:unannotated protein [freshwater metagenome]|uniref:Unannotated protein n=1 Tax=freshwater metagenome TaxID=449393 RepID=A0A6J7VVK0_9ZZZZ